MEDVIRDIDGNEIVAGSFVELLEDTGNMLAGPYKYEGVRWGGDLWSVLSLKICHSSLSLAPLRLLPWKRWRKGQERFQEVIQNIQRDLASGANET